MVKEFIKRLIEKVKALLPYIKDIATILVAIKTLLK